VADYGDRLAVDEPVETQNIAPPCNIFVSVHILRHRAKYVNLDMNDLYLNKYRIPSTRLSNWDYGSQGLYFITICTKDKIPYFGDVILEHSSETQNIASLQDTPIGAIARQNWLDIPKHFDFIELDEFVMMPNHIHGIIYINKPEKETWDINKFGIQSRNLASAIRGYKASVKTFATKNDIEFQWQSRYHDRVIRNEEEYRNMRQYIFENPESWLLEKCS
jgi:putative transposase